MPSNLGKITAKNVSKQFTEELRCLPACELTIALTEAYPSVQAPEILVESLFYQEYQEKLVDELKSRWCEGAPILYAFFDFIQNEIVDFLELADPKGNIHLHYSTDSEFQSVSQSSYSAFKRKFD